MNEVVLIVEDDDSLRFALEEGLAAEGFKPHAVAAAEDAYECLEEVRPDLVLLDWILPGDGGAVACRKLLAARPRLVVVMFTGLTDVRDQRAAFEAGAHAFLRKGIELSALAAELRRVLARERARSAAAR